MNPSHRLTDPRKPREEEFARLLGQYRRQLFRFVYSLVNSMHDAEDLFQQVTITLWDKFDEFDPGTEFFAWACAIAKNKTLNFFKSKGRQRVYFSEELINEIARQEAQREDLQDSRLKALERCRQKLSRKDQQLLAACYRGDVSIQEAAKEIGRPVGSVYDSLSRIRSALHACIQRTLTSEGR